jgi:hypothetical protein
MSTQEWVVFGLLLVGLILITVWMDEDDYD